MKPAMSSARNVRRDSSVHTNDDIRDSACRSENISIKFDQLKTAVLKPDQVADRSAVIGLLEELREECKTSMHPLPTCQEALVEIRQMFKHLTDGKTGESAIPDTSSDDELAKSPSVKFKVRHADWPYLSERRHNDIQQTLHRLGGPWTNVFSVTKQPLKNFNILECYVRHEDQKQKLSEVVERSHGLVPFQEAFQLRHQSQIQKDMYEALVHGVRFPRKLLQADLENRLYRWSEDNNTAIEHVTHRRGTLRLLFADVEKARNLVRHGWFVVDDGLHKVEAWDKTFDRYQCFNCMKDGHDSKPCQEKYKRQTVCLHCAGNHHINQCSTSNDPEKKKCANCGGPHCATDERCTAPEVVKARNKRLIRRGKGPSWMRNTPRKGQDDFVMVESDLSRGKALEASAKVNLRKPVKAPDSTITAAISKPANSVLPSANYHVSGTKSLHEYFPTVGEEPTTDASIKASGNASFGTRSKSSPPGSQHAELNESTPPKVSHAIAEVAKDMLFLPIPADLAIPNLALTKTQSPANCNSNLSASPAIKFEKAISPISKKRKLFKDPPDNSGSSGTLRTFDFRLDTDSMHTTNLTMLNSETKLCNNSAQNSPMERTFANSACVSPRSAQINKSPPPRVKIEHEQIKIPPHFLRKQGKRTTPAEHHSTLPKGSKSYPQNTEFALSATAEPPSCQIAPSRMMSAVNDRSTNFDHLSIEQEFESETDGLTSDPYVGYALDSHFKREYDSDDDNGAHEAWEASSPWRTLMMRPTGFQ